jgi:putative tryptophan/tyrosine transport system substrate-binding protein
VLCALDGNRPKPASRAAKKIGRHSPRGQTYSVDRDRLSIQHEGYLMRRREFIAGLGGAVAWPVVARAQQGERVRRIGVLMGWDDNDTLAKAWFSGFPQGLSELGWTDGRNLRMDVHWAAGNSDRMRMFAKELVGLGPDLILASTTPVTAALQRETRTIPIVFAGISDPVGAGFVASLARPGGNITGFINMEASIGGKWLQLLTEIAPDIKRCCSHIQS